MSSMLRVAVEAGCDMCSSVLSTPGSDQLALTSPVSRLNDGLGMTLY
jgi:hypothetical protein